MARFIFIEETNTDSFAKEFDSEEEAIKHGDYCWERNTAADRKKLTACYILKSINPDVDADNHFDGDIVKEYK